MHDEGHKDWTIEDSNRLYNIDRWGDGFFSINNNGNLSVVPRKDRPDQVIDVGAVLDEVEKLGIPFPVVIRFHDILRAQVCNLNRTFSETMRDAQFQGNYYGVFPIKVNQMREVVEEIVDAGAPFHYGLEAGSKAELLVALAMNHNLNSLTILNGYKDEEYLRLALLGTTIGRKIIVVIEKYTELPELIKYSKEMGVRPLIGIRAKLSTRGCGKWADSSGEKAKFGLTIPEILQAVNLLKEEGFEDCFKLFHFHIGSQIPDIRTIKDAITEGARVYAKLKKMDCPIEYFDVGGGVGVNYDGTKTNCDSSTNYALSEYVDDVVYILKQICDLEDVDHPHIVSETGRAVAAHHSCVITNVFGRVDTTISSYSTEKSPGEHVLVQDMRDIYDDLRPENLQEAYNDAMQKKDEMNSAFKLGILDLEERAKIECLYWKIINSIHDQAKELEYCPEEISDLESDLAQQYLCNFSIFQSAADLWAIGQLLPIVPIKRHNEFPGVQCRLADITCDSDGKVEKFIDETNPRDTLPLHKVRDGENYYIGLFLTGAYQDIMGDMHNLFGRPSEVHVYFDEEDPGKFYIEEVIQGNTADDVLSSLQYSSKSLAMTVKKNIDKQIQRGKIRPRQGVKLIDFYEKCLKEYTYLRKSYKE